ncbi:MAG TPA: hypothetical protein P5273_00855 [Syntrophomonadaceae bacterium]|nr:hypothetical protein [Syntrophomonadaceae bacterium]
MLALLITIWLIIIILELPLLIKKSLYREVLLFTVLFAAGVYMSLAQFYDWPFYNPLKPLIVLLAPRF